MKRLKKTIAVLAAACLLLPTSVHATEVSEPAQPRTVAVCKMEKLPGSWNPLAERTAEAELILSLTTDRLYQVTSEGEINPSLAASLPRDVTAELAGSFGIPANARRGYAFAIDLADNACWENGEPIQADDYLFSIEKMLESGSFPLNLANWEDYSQGTPTPGETIVSLAEAGFSSVREAEDAGITDFFVDTDHFWGLTHGWRSITDRNRMQDTAIPSGLDEMFISPAYLYETYLRDGGIQSIFQGQFVGIAMGEGAPLTREDVGLISVSDHQFMLILEAPATVSSVALDLSELILLRQDIYGENYGTSADTYLSYGPYRVVSANNSEIILEANPRWTGDREAFGADTIRCTSGS